jgi:phosphatidylglycerophosphate synthase
VSCPSAAHPLVVLGLGMRNRKSLRRSRGFYGKTIPEQTILGERRQVMIASLLRAPFIRIGKIFFNTLVASGITPNQITFAGFGLVLVSCGLYLWTKDMFVLGVCLSLSYTFDALDGAVARRTGTATAFGGYLDAVIDRYQEAAGYFVVGIVTGWWPGILLLTVGSMLVSYNKAAAALHTPVNNKGWPDLMERPRRTWLFCAALILNNAIPVPEILGEGFAQIAIWYIAVLVHFTAIQRFTRARRLLGFVDRV